jgi:hypothetical protein
MEKIFENDLLYFDFYVVGVDYENFDILILYDEHVVVVVDYLDKHDFLILLLVDSIFDVVNDEISKVMVVVVDENLFDDAEEILLNELVEKIHQLYFEKLTVLEVEGKNYHSLVVHMNVNDVLDIHFDCFS